MTWLASFIKNGENPNYQAFLHGVERVCAEAGARATRHFPATPDDPVEQAALLRDVVAQRPSAILFAPADDLAMAGPVAEAKAAGIPLIGFVNRMAGEFVTFVGADDAAMAFAEASYLIEALHGRGKVVLIEGPETAPTSRDRGHGFRRALAAAPGVQVLGTLPGLYQHSAGRRAMAAHLAAHPVIDGVICTNDSMALGAIEALHAAGRTALVVGNNGTIPAARAIGAGTMLATMDYCGFRMGALAAMAALRHLSGQPVPREIILPAQVIHAGNHAAWLVPVEQRPLPAWDAVVPAAG
jgi:ribose transport system substrate-binding protein